MGERYYWLKLQRDFFKRHDVRIVESMKNGKDYVLFYLKLLCESIDHEGRLRFNDAIPYNEDMLATITNTDIDVVRSAIKIFTELGLMEFQTDGTYFMAEVQKMIGSASSNPNAIRQQRFRDNHKSQPVLPEITGSVTNSNDIVTDAVTNNNESKSKSKSKRESKSKNNITQDEYINSCNREVPTKGVIRPSEHDAAQLFMERFNAIDGVLPCSRLHATREIQVNALLSNFNAEEIQKAFDNLRSSDFLRGKVSGTNGKAFLAGFDWFINIVNFTKVLEGKYNNTMTASEPEEQEITPEMYLNQKGVI